MRMIDVGDQGLAVLVEAADAETRLERVRGLADSLRRARLAGLTDVVASPGRVTLVYDPLLASAPERLRAEVEAAVAVDRGSAAIAPPTTHELPVFYGGERGPDLDEVCSAHRMDRAEFIAAHTGARYLVEAIGFLPGFGYLAGLPPSLATPRRSTPRRVVAAGSVGIGGGQTGAYPFASPGGWNLVGATPTSLFDVAWPQPSRLGVGDHVRFAAIERRDFDRLATHHERPSPPPIVPGGITVVAPGLFTTIQDLGRPGHRAAGVPLSGAVDAVSLARANRLVGNPSSAAALEITLLGPTLRFDRAATIAVTGASFPGLVGGRSCRMEAGATLTLGHATAGCRGYLAVAGGIDVPEVLGSRSTLWLARLGGLTGLPLAAGDVVPVGVDAGAPSVPSVAFDPPAAGPITLRVIPGEQYAVVGNALWTATHRASSRSDRMGVRFEGEPLGDGTALGSLPSVAVLPGTVQLPPDGRPILLLADAQTIGGYPVIGHVIAADLPQAGQLRPGDVVRWQEVTIADAHRALRAQAAGMEGEG